MKIKIKLLAGYLFMAILILIISVTNLYGLNNTQKQYDSIIHTTEPTVVALREIEFYFTGQANDERGFLLTQEVAFRGQIEAKSAEVKKRIQTIQVNMINDQERELLQKIADGHDQFTKLNLRVIETYNAGDHEQAMQLSFNDGRQIRKDLTASFDALAKMKDSDANNQMLAIRNSANKLSLFGIIFSVFAIFIGIFVSVYNSNKISKPIVKITELSGYIAQGNLDFEVEPIKSKDECGQMYTHFSVMVEKLKKLIVQIRESAEQVAASSEQLNASTEQHAYTINEVTATMTQLATGAENQTKVVSETSTAIGNMSISIQQIAVITDQSASLAAETNKATEEGVASLNKVIDQMNNISQSSNTVHDTVTKLAESSHQISEIINVITGITEQTNLLALNAAIEAARAGEQGRGFAVVAEEVRKLADQSRQAAKQITELIKDNEVNIDNAVTSMAQGVNDVRSGKETANSAGDAFANISSLINELSTQVRQISSATQDMAGNSEQIVESIQSIDIFSQTLSSQTQTVSAASQEQSASIEEIAALSENLAKMADDLLSATRNFSI